MLSAIYTLEKRKEELQSLINRHNNKIDELSDYGLEHVKEQLAEHEKAIKKLED